MLLTLTDHLTCPACGPSVGLIVMMDEVAERRVLAGKLGCPVCRAQYPIEGGIARLGGDDVQAAAAPEGSTEPIDAERVAALMGLGEGSGFALVDGPAASRVAPALAALGTDHELVVALDAALASSGTLTETAVLSVLAVPAVLPIGTGAMRAAAYLGGVPPAARLHELLRVCRPTGRVVVEAGCAGEGAMLDPVAALLEAAGAPVRARDARGLVAVRM